MVWYLHRNSQRYWFLIYWTLRSVSTWAFLTGSSAVRKHLRVWGRTSLPCSALRSAAVWRSSRRSLLQMTWTFSFASMLSSPVASRRSWEEISCSEETCRCRPHSSSCRVCSRGRQRAPESDGDTHKHSSASSGWYKGGSTSSSTFTINTTVRNKVYRVTLHPLRSV